MNRGARVALLGAVLVASVGVLGFAVSAQRLPWRASSARASGLAVNHALNHAQDVRYASPSHVTVQANRDTDVALGFVVRPGMHINSHVPSNKWLIQTQLTFDRHSGIRVLHVAFPAGESFSLAVAPSEKLNVYSGAFSVRARIRAVAGDHILRGSLRYQACDTNSCYPPREVPVAVDVIAR